MTKTVDDMTNDEKLARIRAAMGTQQERDEQREQTYRKNNPPAGDAQQHAPGEIDAEALDSLVKEADKNKRSKDNPLGLPRFLTADEFCKDRRPTPYIIKRHVPRHTLTMVFGQPASGKTFYILDQALSVAAGLPDWHGFRINKGSVLYLTGEAREGLKKRIAAWAMEHGVELSSFPEFKCEYVPTMNLNVLDHVAALLDCIEKQQIKPDWIILDTLFRFMTGDENSTETAQGVVAGCHEIMNRFDCALTLIHHQGVSQEAKEQKRPRGASAFLGALDVVTLIEKNDSSVTAEQTKNKDDDLITIFFKLDGVPLVGWHDEDGETVYSAVLRTANETKASGSKNVEKRDIPLMTALLRCCETGRGELTATGAGFFGVKYSVLKAFYSDPKHTKLPVREPAKVEYRFETSLNALLDGGNIQIANNNEIKNFDDGDREKCIFTPNVKKYGAKFSEYAEAIRQRRAEDGVPSANGGNPPFVFRC